MSEELREKAGVSAAELVSIFDALCDAAAIETLPRFRRGGAIDNKLEAQRDYDPVTEADREAERAIRAILNERFPDHGIVGEEHGSEKPEAVCQWIIDPIDGTRAFVSGLPVWGTLIGLYVDGVPAAGCLDQPFTGERFMATGNGSVLHHRRERTALRTSSTSVLAEATLMTTSPHLLIGVADAGYARVEEAVKMFRYGCDCYAYAMVAAGHIDLVVESGLNVYDIAALIPVIEQAGGVVTNWQGGSASQGGQVIAAANGDLHAAALDLLNG